MLILLPNLLDEEQAHEPFLSSGVADAVKSIQGLFAESERAGRRYLKRFHPDFRNVPIVLINEHTTTISGLLDPLLKGERWGLVTDCGLPCIADPGSNMVLRARELQIPVQAHLGPSAILLTLMLSGLYSQTFTFHGYLNREVEPLKQQIRCLARKTTHLFIEAPYRTQKIFDILVETLADDTLLCVASDLTLPTEKVQTLPIAKWKKQKIEWGKTPATFALFIK